MSYMTQVIKCKRLNNQKYYQTQNFLHTILIGVYLEFNLRFLKKSF